MSTNKERLHASYYEGYICPYCGEDNTLLMENHQILKEQLVDCKYCDETINITTAYNTTGKLNIIAFEHEIERCKPLSA